MGLGMESKALVHWCSKTHAPWGRCWGQITALEAHYPKPHGMPGLQMDGWVRVLRPFNSISVISRRWKGDHERLCAMKRRLGSGRISPPAGFEPATPWSKVGSANRSATRMLQGLQMTSVKWGHLFLSWHSFIKKKKKETKKNLRKI